MVTESAWKREASLSFAVDTSVEQSHRLTMPKTLPQTIRLQTSFQKTNIQTGTIHWTFLFSIICLLTLNPYAGELMGQEKRVAIEVTVEGAVAESADDGEKQEESDDTKAKKKPPISVLTQKGPIQEIADPLDKLIDLGLKNDKLTLSILSTYQEVDPVVDSIREIVGWGGGSSSSGNEGYNFDLSSEKLGGHIRRRKVNKAFVNTILLEETVKPNRSLNISNSDDGMLQITVNAGEAAFILRIRQQSDGQFMVQELNGTEVFAGTASNFENFCRENREYSSTRLLPALKHFGLGQLLTPYSPEVLNRVAELVTPWNSDELTRVKTLTASLASDSYGERVAAAEQLKKEYKGNEAILARLVLDRQFDVETRAVTRKLIREKVDKDKLAELDFVDSIVANLDAPYLIDMIKAQTDDQKRNVLIDRLRELEPELVDTDASNSDIVSMIASQAMNAWVSDEIGKSNDVAQIDPLTEKGHLQKVSGHTGQLLRLIWKGDQLVIDREHWKKPFDGRSISELSEEVSKLIEDSNLPKDWFKQGGSGFAAASAKHPQVLFEKLKEDCGGQSNSNNHYSHYSSNYAGNNSLNRAFDLTKLKAELTFDKSARSNRGRSGSGGNPNKKPLLVVLTEKAGPERSLLIDQNKKDEIRIMISGDKASYIVQLILKKDQAIIQEVRGSEVKAYKAESFRALQQQNADYFRGSFFPLLRHLGVEIAPDIDAGPTANETTSNAAPGSNQFQAERDSAIAT